MVAGTAAGTGKAIPVDEETPAPRRPSKPPLERGADPTNAVEPSSRPSPIAAAIKKLVVPVAVSDNLAQAQAKMEQQRQTLLEEAEEMEKVRWDLNRSMREYNTAHGIASVAHATNRNPANVRGKTLCRI